MQYFTLFFNLNLKIQYVLHTYSIISYTNHMPLTHQPQVVHSCHTGRLRSRACAF